MPKYSASDDLKVVGGKTVIYLNRTRTEEAPARGRPSAAERAEMAKLQAAALAAGARTGVPFCEECEQARRKLASQSGEPA
jgi:hypothetical protein